MLRIIIPLMLLISVCMISQGFGEESVKTEVNLSVFPKELAIGDTCYVLVTATNHSEEVMNVMAPVFTFAYDPAMVQFDLSRGDKIWHGTFECQFHREATRTIMPTYVIPSGKTIVFIAVPLQFPSLDELHTPFWEETLKELKDHPEGLVFDFGIEFSPPQGSIFYDAKIRSVGRLTDQVTLKLRNAEEMVMIEEWYRKTPEDYFPIVDKGTHIRKVPPQGIRKESGKKILGKSPWAFTTIGNRYPGDPNAPETWQGWKELEESISESTMRDEIRLTRMLIQYCDTRDEKIPEELKTWFAEMNEVQRTCMAKSLLDRGRLGFLSPFRNLYKAIHEYDVSAKSESETKFLKQLGLVE
jgi:hypothetical protein